MQKKYHVKITYRAEQDIDEIYEYIARENRKAAIAFAGELERQIVTLERFPLRCPVISESEEIGLEYRHLMYREYRTVFRIEGTEVYICRVIHGARLLDASLIET